MKYDKINNFETPHTKFQIGQQVQIVKSLNMYYLKGDKAKIIQRDGDTYLIKAHDKGKWWVMERDIQAIGESNLT